MPPITTSPQLLEDLWAIITRTRSQVAGAFNQGLVMMIALAKAGLQPRMVTTREE